MIERAGISDRRVEYVEANHIFRHGNQLSYLHIASLTKRLERLDVLPAAYIQCVVDRNQITTVMNQWTHLVDQPCTVGLLVHFAFGCGRKEWGIDNGTIEGFAASLESADRWEEVRSDEIVLVNGK